MAILSSSRIVSLTRAVPGSFGSLCTGFVSRIVNFRKSIFRKSICSAQQTKSCGKFGSSPVKYEQSDQICECTKPAESVEIVWKSQDHSVATGEISVVLYEQKLLIPMPYNWTSAAETGISVFLVGQCLTTVRIVHRLLR